MAPAVHLDVFEDKLSRQANLENAAYDVADEFRDGKFPEIGAGQSNGVWAALCKELAKRCPGFSEDEYRSALDRGFIDSR